MDHVCALPGAIILQLNRWWNYFKPKLSFLYFQNARLYFNDFISLILHAFTQWNKRIIIIYFLYLPLILTVTGQIICCEERRNKNVETILCFSPFLYFCLLLFISNIRSLKVTLLAYNAKLFKITAIFFNTCNRISAFIYYLPYDPLGENLILSFQLINVVISY